MTVDSRPCCQLLLVNYFIVPHHYATQQTKPANEQMATTINTVHLIIRFRSRFAVAVWADIAGTRDNAIGDLESHRAAVVTTSSEQRSVAGISRSGEPESCYTDRRKHNSRSV